METRNSWNASAETTRVHAARAVAFKRCCMPSGRFDGSLRDYYRRE
jgi:hypothetical protein